MTKKLNLSRVIFILGVPLSIILTSVFLAKNGALYADNATTMNMAITLDLVVLTPLVYFLLIRKKKISKFTVVPFFVIGLVIASFVIPKSGQQTLDLIKTWVLPLVELTVLTIVITKVIAIRRLYKEKRTNSLSFMDAVKESTEAVFPQKMAAALRMEIGMIYYSFFAWKKPGYNENEFTYHKESGILGILGVLLGVAMVELFCVHLLLISWSPVFTWILTVFSAYGVIQIFGIMKSIPRTPIKIENNTVKIRFGNFQETEFQLNEIEVVELTMADYPKADKTYQKITLFDHNCIIHLKSEATIHGLFGLKKNYQHLVLSVDDKQRFKAVLENEV